MAQITKREIERAAANGIGFHTLTTRVYGNGMDIEEAVSKRPKKMDNPWSKWKETAKANGISCSKFYQRIGRGWEHEKAATTPSDTKYRSR
jgi:hypothetical protein